MASNPSVLWAGPVFDPSGYGQASRRYVSGLDATGRFNLKLKPWYFYEGSYVCDRSLARQMLRLEQTPLGSRDPFVFIQHATPNTWKLGPSSCRYHIGVTTFETDSVPQVWQQHLRQMDELFVFSQFNAEVFAATGIRRPITVIPHGVDTERFRPGLAPHRAVAALRGEGDYIFGSAFDWCPRKNPLGLLRAYHKAFRRTDPVLLVLKTYKYPMPPDKSLAFVKSQIESLRTEMGMTRTSSPRVAVLTDMCSDEDVAAFYNSLDAYVLPSRGEGWSLTHSEAMSCGLPTIAVGWSGNLDFQNDSNSYLLKSFRLIPVSQKDAGDRPLYIGHRWADFDTDELSLTMQTMVNFPGLARAKGAQARKDMVQSFTWEIACGRMADRLDVIAGRSRSNVT